MSNMTEVTPWDCCDGGIDLFDSIYEGCVREGDKILLNTDNILYKDTEPTSFTTHTTEIIEHKIMFGLFTDYEVVKTGEVLHEGFYLVKLVDGSSFYIREEDCQYIWQYESILRRLYWK